jgi:transposase
LLIEASYHYRRQPGVGLKLERRQRDQPPEIINIAWRAQRRLNARWRQLKDARHKPNGIVAVAIARELACYCWEIATHPVTVPPASMPAGDPLTHATPVPQKQKPTSARRISASL